MGSVAVGAMVIGTSMLVVFALAIASLDNQVEESIAQIEATAEPVAQFTIDDANDVVGAVVNYTINDGGANYTAGQVEVNGSTGTFLADLVISGGVVTGLEILDHGSSYLNSPTTYYLEVTAANTGTNLNITATIGTLVYTNITNTGSTSIHTDDGWLFTDGANPINLSANYDGYNPGILFSGETLSLYYYTGSYDAATRIAVKIDGVIKGSGVA